METATSRLFSRHILKCCRRFSWSQGRRTFLSDAYKCQDLWDARTSLPIFKDLNMDKFYLAIDKNFQTKGKVLPVDIDIFAVNAVSDQQLDDLQDVLHRFRRTPLTTGALPSTGHALVRALLAAPDPERRQRLLDVLDDRMNYGVFLDTHTANMCMDTFLKEGNYRDAAKIATHLMLQEEWSDPINRALALYSCCAYVENPVPEPWRQPDPEEDPKAETEFIRVKYLRNEWNDAHFDLREWWELCGKTLAWVGASGDQLGDRSCQLLGWALWRQWDQLRQCCDRLQGSDGVCRDTLERVAGLLADAGDSCPDAAALSARVSALPAADAPLLETLRSAAESAVAEHEPAAVAQLRATYADWERRRLEALEQQRQAEERARRVQALEEKRQELRERERLLWFFDREEQLLAEVDRQWNRPQPPKPPHVQKLLRKKRPTQADYVPPHVQRTHNQ
ncbi:uncharacterized protein LOC122363351 [Amphibalanus amphitrite]|uniref:uncharacterized protein LOC122363351 n=1 Tax=Amphibalanus amphitrite TaxID=1232801 RepID=UPI001C90FFFB|nr:uncharacterized protein LOC122363351 [Amphibalanus amphitrite]XP_043188457.1 uncharacterized protein LOC122363351 [Amphibalanus amphitrite]XP_043188458.1 uncharacterized protein LOC122363351 [Amphibalanus amphitrite]